MLVEESKRYCYMNHAEQNKTLDVEIYIQESYKISLSFKADALGTCKVSATQTAKVKL